MEKVVDFTQFEEKKTHTSLCIILHLCTIATVTVHICMVTVALPFNILMFLFIILMLYSYGIKSTSFTLFFSLLSLGITNASACLSLFHSWALPLIFSLHLLLINSCSLSSPQEIMWSVWGFCSPVRKVDQLGGISIRLWGNFL